MSFLIEPYNAWQKPPKKKHWMEIAEEEHLYFKMLQEQQSNTSTVDSTASPTNGGTDINAFRYIQFRKYLYEYWSLNNTLSGSFGHNLTCPSASYTASNFTGVNLLVTTNSIDTCPQEIVAGGFRTDTTWSFACWAKIDAVFSGPTLFSCLDTASLGGCKLTMLPNRRTMLWQYDSIGQLQQVTNAVNTGLIIQGIWILYSGGYDGVKMRLRMNTVENQAAGSSFTPSTGSSAKFTFGNEPNTDTPPSSSIRIGDVLLYQGIYLTDSDISYLYNSTNPTAIPTSSVAYNTGSGRRFPFTY